MDLNKDNDIDLNKVSDNRIRINGQYVDEDSLYNFDSTTNLNKIVVFYYDR